MSAVITVISAVLLAAIIVVMTAVVPDVNTAVVKML